MAGAAQNPFPPAAPPSTPMEATEHTGVHREAGVLYTVNLTPGRSVYGEDLVREGGREYRAWNPRRSKLAALLVRTENPLRLPRDAAVLYLGAGTGTTASHLSDMLPGGTVYAVEVARTAFEKLLHLAEGRGNLVPLLADARRPEAYRSVVGRAELLYQDVAQRDQAGIFLQNAALLDPGGEGILMVKARSVDVAAVPGDVFRRVEGALGAGGLTVTEVVPLAPDQRDHAALRVHP